jgi:hypothetical protein
MISCVVTMDKATAPTSTQLAAWRRLWGLLLAPDLASPISAGEGSGEVITHAPASPQGASPLATHCVQESPTASGALGVHRLEDCPPAATSEHQWHEHIRRSKMP